MKQVLQDRRTGDIIVAELPAPQRVDGHLLVEVRASVISAGTEGVLVAATGRSLWQRIAEKPELLKKGVDTLKARGLAALRNQIESKYAGYEPLGYSCAGVVREGDPAAAGLAPGGRVACGGIGFASHAETILVPHRLCARVPDNVDDETAAYATLGAIAMQGVRQAGVVLGEHVAVIGLGLVGLLTAQVLRAAGCTVTGIDPAPAARARGKANGCAATTDRDGAREAVLQATRGLGADAVLICAATEASDPVVLAGELARSRGRVVMVGATGMELPRELYFRKELTFALSRSYGPGRYDPTYEEAGVDYPPDYVRFTEQRNLQAFLDLAAVGAISVSALTTHRFSIADAPQAYALLRDPAVERAGILLTYAEKPAPAAPAAVRAPATRPAGTPGISFIGAGGYAENVLLPLLRESGAALRGVAARRPDRAASAGARFGFAFHTADPGAILDDPDTHAVFIASRHDSHAAYTIAALNAGKHVWTEKPLVLREDELERVAAALDASSHVLAVGFNRRFSPLTAKLKAWLPPGSPWMATIRVNAGHLPPEHWTQDPAAGGGRLLGEGCHFLDYLCHLADAPPVRVHSEALRSERRDLPAASNFAITVSFRNGAVGQLLYASEGAASLPKERIEVFCGGRAAVLEDFHRLTLHDARGQTDASLARQDKGQVEMLRAFLAALRGAEFPLTRDAILTTARLTLAAQRSLERGEPVALQA